MECIAGCGCAALIGSTGGAVHTTPFQAPHASTSRSPAVNSFPCRTSAPAARRCTKRDVASYAAGRRFIVAPAHAIVFFRPLGGRYTRYQINGDDYAATHDKKRVTIGMNKRHIGRAMSA
jgi:hypothetical protein